jgi:spermidine/putrescine transport system substrate-binding protein
MQDERDGLGPMEMAERLAREVGEGRLSRREFITRAAALGIGVSALGGLLAACGSSSSSTNAAASASPTPLDTTLPKKLFIYNWSDYSSQKVYDDFKKEYGITVVESFYDGNETLNTKLRAGAGGYDVIFPTDKWVSIESKSGLIQPLHMDLIPNFAKYVTQPLFKAPPFDDPAQQGGKKYSVPYMFGSTGIGIRRDKVPDADTVDSWGIMWDSAWKRQISMLDEPVECINAALMYLGYPANSTDQAQIDAATNKLIEQKPLVVQYTSTVDKREMIQGVPLVHCWDGDAAMAMRDIGQKNLRYMLPKEGFMLWMDGICIPTTAPSPYAAHLFLNFILDPKNAAEAANYIGYQPAVEAAMQYITDPVQKAMRPTPEILQKGQLPKDLGAFEQMYQDAWAKVKSA